MEQTSEIKFGTVKLIDRESVFGKQWTSARASQIPNLRTDFMLYTQILLGLWCQVKGQLMKQVERALPIPLPEVRKLPLQLCCSTC